MLCIVLTILGLIVVFSGFGVILLGLAVDVFWVVGLLISAVGLGPAGAAAYAAASWWLLLVGFGIAFLGFVIVSLGVLLLWFFSALCSASSSGNTGSLSALFSGLTGTSAPQSGLPNLPGIDLSGLFGASSLLGLLFLTVEQRATLPSNLLQLIDCLRGCLCSCLCAGSSGGVSPPSGDVPPDVSKAIEDLRAQLRVAQQKLAQAILAGNVQAANDLRHTISELRAHITALGG